MAATTKIKAIKNGQVKEFGVVQWARLARKENGVIVHDGWEETDAPLRSEPFNPAEIRSNAPAKKKKQEDAAPAEVGDAEAKALKDMTDLTNGKAPAKAEVKQAKVSKPKAKKKEAK
jgi:hypothetical protein